MNNLNKSRNELEGRYAGCLPSAQQRKHIRSHGVFYAHALHDDGTSVEFPILQRVNTQYATVCWICR